MKKKLLICFCAALWAPLNAADHVVSDKGPAHYEPLHDAVWTDDEWLRFAAETVHGGRLIAAAAAPSKKSPANSAGASASASDCPTIPNPGFALPPPKPFTPTCPEGFQWTLIPDQANTLCVQIACNAEAHAAVKTYFELIQNPDHTYSYPISFFNIKGYDSFNYGIIRQDILFNDNKFAQCFNYFAKTLDDAKLLEKFEPPLKTKSETFCGPAPDSKAGIQLQFCTDLPAGFPAVTCPITDTQKL